MSALFFFINTTVKVSITTYQAKFGQIFILAVTVMNVTLALIRCMLSEIVIGVLLGGPGGLAPG